MIHPYDKIEPNIAFYSTIFAGQVPGYQADTLTSIRRSKERSAGGGSGGATDSPTRFRRTPSNRSRAAAAGPPLTQAGERAKARHSATSATARPSYTAASKLESAGGLSRTPSYISDPPSANRRDSKQIELSVSGHLSRYGSVRAPHTPRTDQNLLRSFSLRRKGPEDFLHTASMPCLANPDHVKGAPAAPSRDKNSNYFSVSGVRPGGGGGGDTARGHAKSASSAAPSSPSLVLNSLAYQVLPEQSYGPRSRPAPAPGREHKLGGDWSHAPLAPAGSYGSTGSTSYSSSASASSASSSLSLHRSAGIQPALVNLTL